MVYPVHAFVECPQYQYIRLRLLGLFGVPTMEEIIWQVDLVITMIS